MIGRFLTWLTSGQSTHQDTQDRRPPTSPDELVPSGTLRHIGRDGIEEFFPLLSRPTIADHIHTQRFYRDDHPATPDTFYAGMLHAARIARDRS